MRAEGRELLSSAGQAIRSTLRGAEESVFQTNLKEMKQIIDLLPVAELERMAKLLAEVRDQGGRLFILGVGGGAGHASHAVADFRNLAGFEAYSPADNVSCLTAQINDHGWNSAYVHWLKQSRLNSSDGVMVFSVGGGSIAHEVSVNISCALRFAREIGCTIVGVVGRDGGDTALLADACVIVPTVNPELVTPYTEMFQAVVWHLLVAHPLLKRASMKWEGMAQPLGKGG